MFVKYRKDRSCYVAVDTINGKRVKRQGKTKKEATDKIESLSKTMNATIDKDIYEACKEYHTEISSRKAKKNNEKNYLNRFIQYFDELGKTQIKEIKLKNMQGLQRWLLSKHKLSESTVNRHFSTYGHFLKWCYRNDYCDKIPTVGIESLKCPKHKKRPMLDSEYQELLNHSPDWLKPALQFFRLTGERPSSFCNLTWENVDFKKSILTYEISKGFSEPQQKVFPLHGELKDLLTELFLSGPLKGPNSPILTNKAGGRLTPSHFTKSASKVRKRAQVSVKTYRLRDAFITDLINSGVPASRAIKLTGHSSERMLREYVGEVPTETMISDIKCLEKERLNRMQHDISSGAEMAQKARGCHR